MDSPPCPFCQIAHRERKANIVAEFKHCFAIEDQFPVAKGHLLIIPFAHTENWFTATIDVQQNMLETLPILKEMLDSQYRPDGYNIGLNCGIAAGQTIFHLHLHLIPRYNGDMLNPRGGVRGVIPSKQQY